MPQEGVSSLYSMKFKKAGPHGSLVENGITPSEALPVEESEMEAVGV
jgi:hypothetical protein